ncbi:MAG TPA: LysR family transcriptional regulator [Rhizobium sp.]|nr:LysR family transcriptional regulator [Rhizobium sp.]
MVDLQRGTPSLLGSRIPLVSLIQMLAVAEHLNSHHAANTLGVSQSSVSARIRALRKNSASCFLSATLAASGYYLTFLYLPRAEEVARAESWLYEGRESTCVDPQACYFGWHESLRKFAKLVEPEINQ